MVYSVINNVQQQQKFKINSFLQMFVLQPILNSLGQQRVQTIKHKKSLMRMCIQCLIQIALVAESQLLRLGVIQKLFKQIRMDKIQYTGWPGKCSPQQLKTLAAFREHVEKMGINATAFDDAYLLRFLRARKFDLEKTIKMWTDFINWRIQNHVDTIETIKLPEIPQVRKCYPHGYHKTDKFFRPIYIERVGKLNIDELWKHTKQERMLQYYTLSYETLLKKIFPSCTAFKNTMNNDGVAVTQTLTILDLKDVSLTSAPKAYSFIKPASKLAQDNYPQMLGTMFIINAPFLFKGVWLMIKPWLDEKTTNKIKILGSSYKKELLQFVDAQNIPDFLDGGKCKCPGNGGDCLSWNIGPWNPQGKELFQYAVDELITQNIGAKQHINSNGGSNLKKPFNTALARQFLRVFFKTNRVLTIQLTLLSINELSLSSLLEIWRIVMSV